MSLEKGREETDKVSKNRKWRRERVMKGSIHFHTGPSEAQGLEALSFSLPFWRSVWSWWIFVLYCTGLADIEASSLLEEEAKATFSVVKRSSSCPCWRTTAAKSQFVLEG